MPPETDAVAINRSAIQAMLDLPKLYGPNGFLNRADHGTAGPPAGLVAVLEQLETAVVDPTLLAGSQTVASVEAQTVADLTSLSRIIHDELRAASVPLSSIDREQVLIFDEPQYPVVADRLAADAKLFTPGAAKPPVTVTGPPPPPASGVEQYLVTNLTAGVSDWQDGQGYAGPVADLQNEFVTVTADSLNVTATKPNNFIHTGAGDDAIDVSLFMLTNGGTNVLDGGGGSNFLVGGYTSRDTFFVDGRGAAADVWSTVANFHKGDAVTLFGVTSSGALDWQDGQGAAGFTGLTLHAAGPGRPVVSMTLAGYARADLANGRLAVSFGRDPASGSDYMLIQGN